MLFKRTPWSKPRPHEKTPSVVPDTAAGYVGYMESLSQDAVQLLLADYKHVTGIMGERGIDQVKMTPPQRQDFLEGLLTKEADSLEFLAKYGWKSFAAAHRELERLRKRDNA